MNELVVSIVIILFPGIISTLIADKIIVHSKPWTSFKYGLYSFVLGVFCYLILQIFGGILYLLSKICFLSGISSWPITGELDIWKIVTSLNDNSYIDLIEVLAAVMLSPFVAFIFSAMVYKKWINTTATFFKVSSKYGDENLFSYFLNSNEINWIYIRDVERKLTYKGLVVSFSEDTKVQEIVLSDVTVYGYENSDEYYSVPLIYLCRPHGCLIIEGVPSGNQEEKNVEETT